MNRGEREENEAALRPILGTAFERTVGLAAAFARCVDAKGGYHPSHSQGVEQIARSVAEHMGCFEAAHIARIALAGLLHDVGKLLVPDRILLKASPLTADERIVMRRHALDGERIMIAAGYGDEALWVRHHHCRWDGSGYPDQLKGEEIPIEARVVGVADAFHAMQSDRPYNRARSIDWAMAELSRKAGTQFDPATVDAVLTMAKTR